MKYTKIRYYFFLFLTSRTSTNRDCWKAYDYLQPEGYEHPKVNHKCNFIDPDTGAHTNTVNEIGGHLKKRCHGSGGGHAIFEGYLAKASFQAQHPEDKERMHPFLLRLSSIPQSSKDKV